ncbi:GNAT family N-acetyltransferase [Prauserella cavernicola]|uniref:N-acetyltransferase n=1 Tax=Prauserella cavernicola TaxID=2800127 RepID=A0A934QNW4_9PSEU|nr:GNAT family N-acetyltransferase [Prauserella cavernicola]MBK1782729.1 N-acetyltransferase [Prauserella cavernicola]
MTEQTTPPSVVRNEERNRYEVWSGDRLAGFTEYRERGDRTVFVHTEVDEAFAGQGLGKVLAAGALDDVVERGRVIVPICPFIAKFLDKNPGYEPHVKRRESGK